MKFNILTKTFLLGLVALVMSCQNDYDDKIVRVTQENTAATVTCAAPTNLTASAITQTTATASWTPGGSETTWEVYIGTAGSAAPSGSGAVTTSSTYAFNGLSSATSYQFYVRGSCSATDSSSWSGPFTFTTN